MMLAPLGAMSATNANSRRFSPRASSRSGTRMWAPLAAPLGQRPPVGRGAGQPAAPEVEDHVVAEVQVEADDDVPHRAVAAR